MVSVAIGIPSLPCTSALSSWMVSFAIGIPSLPLIALASWMVRGAIGIPSLPCTSLTSACVFTGMFLCGCASVFLSFPTLRPSPPFSPLLLFHVRRLSYIIMIIIISIIVIIIIIKSSSSMIVNFCCTLWRRGECARHPEVHRQAAARPQVHGLHRPVGLVVKASASCAEDPGLGERDFSWVGSYQWLKKMDPPVATLPGAWRYRVSAGTGWPSVSILWLGEMESLVCNF